MNNKLIIIAIIFLTSVRFFSFVLIDEVVIDLLEVGSIFVLVLYNLSSTISLKTPFVFYVKSIIILSLLSAIPAFMFHDQGFGLSLLASRVVFFWLLYFTLHKMNIPVHKLEKLMLFFGIIWAMIMILQQFTYPNIYFNAYDGVTYENGEIRTTETRGGITRIMINGFGFCYFMAAFTWQELRKNISLKNIFLFALIIAGVLLTQSRQIIFGLILIFVVDTFLSFRLNDTKSIRFVTIFLGISILFFTIAGDFIIALIELSQEQNITSNQYIRGLEIEFFLFKYWPDPFCYLLGNGWDHSNSPYGQEMKEQIQRSMGFHRSDIGLIGAFNKFGIIYIIVIVMFYIMILIPKKHFIVPKYIRIFFILCALTSLSGANFFELSAFFVPFTCLFYIIDKTNEEYLYNYSNSQQATADSERHEVFA
jgi:hypothetical protein